MTTKSTYENRREIIRKNKILYVSDLDGTLLRNDEKTSPYTNSVINLLVERGLFFSYATARSFVTASKVTNGINAKIPVIVYNGAFIIDNKTHEILLSNFFDCNDVYEIREILYKSRVHPIDRKSVRVGKECRSRWSPYH